MGILKTPLYSLDDNFLIDRTRELYPTVELFEQMEQV